jgi:hypothetical protein
MIDRYTTGLFGGSLQEERFLEYKSLTNPIEMAKTREKGAVVHSGHL